MSEKLKFRDKHDWKCWGDGLSDLLTWSENERLRYEEGSFLRDQRCFKRAPIGPKSSLKASIWPEIGKKCLRMAQIDPNCAFCGQLHACFADRLTDSFSYFSLHTQVEPENMSWKISQSVDIIQKSKCGGYNVSDTHLYGLIQPSLLYTQ